MGIGEVGSVETHHYLYVGAGLGIFLLRWMIAFIQNPP
ncbi:hypothetical protein MC7420_2003 [Coleofasciculus chthonoplastes PCC 7420]|uniref:Uncharacterized protein n=1 Tax=Coleofasciculus chthonoplastes PCC 7420 TaxID=118168 RepID=B4VMK2_9CYAN|nr:hypothetical protein MC7420_2003 [Coleofasciculus chthonoplastes PCC 7420]